MSAMLLSLLLCVAPVTPDGGTVVVKGQRFLTEVARTQREQARGLMYRQSLAKDRCMFFLYEEDGYHSIWMKNCLINLDVVWLKADGTVTEIAPSVPPVSPMWTGPDEQIPTYGGKVTSRYFIEFPSGTTRRLGLEVGEKIGWDLRLADGSVVRGGVPVPKDSLGRKQKK